MRENIVIGKRKFVAIWQANRKVWDVYTLKGGYLTRVFVANQPSLREAKIAIRARLSR